MLKRLASLLLSLLLLLEGAAPLWAFDKPKKPFYEKSGWFDHASNTMRRVAERGERGAYELYKNNNPAPRNQYEKANMHQINLDDLAQYTNSQPYRQARQIRDAFLGAAQDEETSAASGEVSPEDLSEIRSALTDMMTLYSQYGDSFPAVAQTALEVSRQLLPLQKQYHLFTPAQLADLHALYMRVLNHDTLCGQGSGYRLFCEGRADALDGLAVLASGPEDARTIARVLEQDIQGPFITRELLVGASALLSLGAEELLEGVLSKAAKEEGETFWQKIDIFMVGHWINKIQFSQGRYLGNVSAAAVIPEYEGQAAGNSWEELARLLQNEGNPTPASRRLLERYGLGSCEASADDVAKGRPTPADGNLYFTSVQCRTLLPFLVGALSSGVKSGASDSLAKASEKINLSPASFVARLYFENVLGDVDAETELRVDGLLYDVFEQDAARAEKSRREAVTRNEALENQIKPLRERLARLVRDPRNYYQSAQGESAPEGLRLKFEISELERQKVNVPSVPSASIEKYNRQSRTYRRKVTGQKVYGAAAGAASIIDAGLSLYYTVALGGAVARFAPGAVRTGLSVKRGLDAVRAGHITADVRRLARLSARLKKLRSVKMAAVAKSVKDAVSQGLVAVVTEDARASRAVAAPERISALAAQLKTSSVPSVADVKPAPNAPIRPVSAEPKVSVPSASHAAVSLENSLPALRVGEARRALQALNEKWASSSGVLKNLSSVKDPARWEGLFADVKSTRLLQSALWGEAQGLKPSPGSVAGLSYNPAVSRGIARNISTGYFRFLSSARQELPWWNLTGKARITKRMYGALKEFDAWASPAELDWSGNVIPFGSALRRRAAQLWVSPLPLRDRASLWFLRKRLYAGAEFSPETAVGLRLELESLSAPFKGPRGVFTWGPDIEPDALFLLSGLRGKIFMQTPVSQTIRKGFARGRENVLFVHGHGESASGAWRFWSHGFDFSKGSETMEDILRAAARSGSSSTSVYLTSCQSGRAVEDFLALTAKEPRLGRNVQLFTPTGYRQLAVGESSAGAFSFDGARGRLSSLLYEKIIRNGDGLAGRAVIDGKVLDPLAASIEKLSAQIKTAAPAYRASFTALRRELQALKDISVADNPSALGASLVRLERLAPGSVSGLKYPLHQAGLPPQPPLGSFAVRADMEAWMPTEYMWGVRRLNHAQIPFVRLKQTWVDYVAATAREMYGVPASAAASAVRQSAALADAPVLSLSARAVQASSSALKSSLIRRIGAAQQELAAVPDGVSPAPLVRRLEKMWAEFDALQPKSWGMWGGQDVVTAEALRARLREVSARKDLTPLQRREIASLKKEIYGSSVQNLEKRAGIQMRLMSLPFLEKTPNSVWLQGGGFESAANQMVNFKTPLGFYRPHIVKAEPLDHIVPLLRPAQENVIFADVHGYVSSLGVWKGTLVPPGQMGRRPLSTLNMSKLFQTLEESGSAHTYTYLHGCRSGWIFGDLKCLFKEKPSMVKSTEWFTPTAPMQSASYEVLPEAAAAGTARARLLDKLLLKIKHNGTGLAARALIEGRDVYPLKAAVRRLGREIASAPAARQKALRALEGDLQALLKIADAKDGEALFAALENLEKRSPGSVENLALWQRLVDKARQISRNEGYVRSQYPDTFMWGKTRLVQDISGGAPFVRLKQTWVDYVAKTAQDLFADAVSAGKKGAPAVSGAQSFEPVFSSKAAEYVVRHRDPSLPAGKVPESFFRVPADMPAPDQIVFRRQNMPASRQAALRERYAQLQSQFLELKKETDVSLYYLKNDSNALPWQKRRELTEQMRELNSHLLSFQYNYLQGSPLQNAADWLDYALEVLFPVQRGHALRPPVLPRPDRVYAGKEFFLRDAGGKSLKTPRVFASAQQKEAWLARERASLPPNLRVAVLNNDPEVLGAYRGWLAKGILGKPENWSLYPSITDFVKESALGKKFDLIITDLNFADGSAYYFVTDMRVNGRVKTPVIASSSFPEDVVSGAELFKAGFDGYLAVPHLTAPEGETALLRALNNYFKCQRKHGWAR